MSEEMIVRHCAPTLAGIKTGSTFTCSFADREALHKRVVECNRMLKPKGVCVAALRVRNNRALIYVFRPKRLRKDLEQGDVCAFLARNGYRQNSMGHCLRELAGRLCGSQPFPHEIGLFLGYPLSDVEAFIRHQGQNSQCVGCWKAYSGGCEARKIFARYKKCTHVYCKRYCEGMSILRLTVAA